MVLIEDFTMVPEGTRVASEGSVTRCPRCGRNGIRRSRYGAVWFVHVQVAQMLPDGLRVEPEDCCTPEMSVA